MSVIRCLLLGAVLSLFLFSVRSVPQIEYTEDSKIAGSEWGYVGNSVALWRRRAVVGAIYTQNGAGAAFVMERGRGVRSTGKWRLVENLIPTSIDLTEGDYYGQAVGIFGNTAAVSSLQMYHGKGAVFVFRREVNGEWSEVSHLEPPEGSVQPKDNYGYRVALHHNILLVSAPHHRVNGKPKAGRVFCYHMNAPASQEVLTSAVDDSRVAGNIRQVWESCGDAVPMSLDSDDKFGSSVAVYGNLAAIGAPGRDMVHIFKKRGHRKPVFEYQTTLSPPAARGSDFGCALSMAAGGLLVIGAQRKATSTGQAYVYRSKPFRPFKLEATLVAEDKVSPNDYFGWSVAASSDLIAVGAPFAQTIKQNAGVVVIFRYLNETKSWDQGTPVQASRASHAGFTNSYFGFSVGVSKLGPHAHALLVGSPGEDKQKGAALVYRECSRDCKNLSVLDPLSCRCKCVGMWRGLDCNYCNPPTCASGEVGVVTNGTCACGPRPPMPSVAPHMVPRNDSTTKEELDAVAPSIVGKGSPAKNGHATIVGKGPGSSYTDQIIGSGPTGGEGFRHVRTDDFKNSPCNATCGDNGRPHPSKCGCVCSKHYSGSSCQVPPGCHSLNGLSAAQRKHHCVMRPHCHYHKKTGKCGSHKSRCHAVNNIHDSETRHKVCSAMSKCVSSCAKPASAAVLAQPDGSSSGLVNGGMSNGTSCSCGPAPASKAVYATRGGSEPIPSEAGSTQSPNTLVGKSGVTMSTANGTVASANQQKDEKLDCVDCQTPPGETKSTANATVAPANVAAAAAAGVPGVMPPPAPPAPAPVQAPGASAAAASQATLAPVVAKSVASVGGAAAAAAVAKVTKTETSTPRLLASPQVVGPHSVDSSKASASQRIVALAKQKNKETPLHESMQAMLTSAGPAMSSAAPKIDHIKVETSGFGPQAQKPVPVVNSESTIADVPESLQKIDEDSLASGKNSQREMRPAAIKEKSLPGESREGNALPFSSFDHTGRKMNAASKPTGGMVENHESEAPSGSTLSRQPSADKESASSKPNGKLHEMKRSSHLSEEDREKELFDREESEGRHAASPVAHAVSDRKQAKSLDAKAKGPMPQGNAEAKVDSSGTAASLATVGKKVADAAEAPTALKLAAKLAGNKVMKSASKIVKRAPYKPPEGAFVASTALAANVFKTAVNNHPNTIDVTPPSSEEASQSANEYVHYHRKSNMKPSGPSTFETRQAEKHFAQTEALREDLERRKEWEEYQKMHGIPNMLTPGALSASGLGSVSSTTATGSASKSAAKKSSERGPTIADSLTPPQNATVIMTGSKEDKERQQAKKEKMLNMPPESDEEKKEKKAAAKRLDAHGPDHQDASSDVSVAHLASPGEERGEHVPTVVPNKSLAGVNESSSSQEKPHEDGHVHSSGTSGGEHEGEHGQSASAGHGKAANNNSTNPHPSSYAHVPEEHSMDTMGNTTEYHSLQYQGAHVVPSTRGVGAGNGTAEATAHGTGEGPAKNTVEEKQPAHAPSLPSGAPPSTKGKPSVPSEGSTSYATAQEGHAASKSPKPVNVTLPSDEPAPPAEVIMNGSKEDKERAKARQGRNSNETEEERVAKEKAARALAYDAPDGVNPASDVVVAERGNVTVMSDEASVATVASANGTESAAHANTTNANSGEAASVNLAKGVADAGAASTPASGGASPVIAADSAPVATAHPAHNAPVIMTGSKGDPDEAKSSTSGESEQEIIDKMEAAKELAMATPDYLKPSSDITVAKGTKGANGANQPEASNEPKPASASSIETKKTSPSVGSSGADGVAQVVASSPGSHAGVLASGSGATDFTLQSHPEPTHEKKSHNDGMKPASKPTYDSEFHSQLPEESHEKRSGLHEIKLVSEKQLDHPEPEPAHMKPASDPTFGSKLPEAKEAEDDRVAAGVTADHFLPSSKATFSGLRSSPEEHAKTIVKPTDLTATALVPSNVVEAEKDSAPETAVARKNNLRAVSNSKSPESNELLHRKRYHPSSPPTAKISQHPVVKFVGTHAESAKASNAGAPPPLTSHAVDSAGGAVASVVSQHNPKDLESHDPLKENGSAGTKLENLIAHPQAALDQIKKELGIDFDEQL